MAARLKARPEILDRRHEMVEHPFGSIKQWMNQGAFLTKGLDNVRAEFSLTAPAKAKRTLSCTWNLHKSQIASQRRSRAPQLLECTGARCASIAFLFAAHPQHEAV
jgi:hypothetical protein